MMVDISLSTYTILTNIKNWFILTEQTDKDITWVNQARFTYLNVQHEVRSVRICSREIISQSLLTDISAYTRESL